eukprot:3941564-Rhodomonas_salina.5
MELLLKAVKAGKTMQEARVGIALAQFQVASFSPMSHIAVMRVRGARRERGGRWADWGGQAMGEEERAAMEERAKKKFGQMPAGPASHTAPHA